MNCKQYHMLLQSTQALQKRCKVFIRQSQPRYPYTNSNSNVSSGSLPAVLDGLNPVGGYTVPRKGLYEIPPSPSTRCGADDSPAATRAARPLPGEKRPAYISCEYAIHNIQ